MMDRLLALAREGITLFQDHPVVTLMTLIGLAASIQQLASWLAGLKSKRLEEHLRRVAVRHMEQEATEKTLQEKRATLANVAQEVAKLQDKIDRELPAEARRAVLRDRLELQIETLTKTHAEVLVTQAALTSLGESADIPDALRKAVEAHIRPEYLVRQQISKAKTQLTLVSSAIAVINYLLPYPINRFVLTVGALLAIPLLLRLADLSLPTDADYRHRIRSGALFLLFGLPGTFLFGLGLTIGGSALFDGDRSDLLLVIIAIGLGVIFLAGSLFIWWRNRTWLTWRLLLPRRNSERPQALHLGMPTDGGRLTAPAVNRPSPAPLMHEGSDRK